MDRSHDLEIIYSELFDKKTFSSAVFKLCKIANDGPHTLMEKQLICDCILESKIFGYIDTAIFQDSDFFNGLFLSNRTFFPITYLGSEVDEKIVLTPEQFEVLNLFKEKKKICISAPTSFGKTFVLFEILVRYSDVFHNSIIIVPTNALCTEIFHKINSIKLLKEKYNVTNYFDPQTDYGYDNIFILTPERADILLENYKEEIDFFMMDEIYKINNGKDERNKIFDNVLYRLLNKTKYCYLAGPYITEFDDNIKNVFFKKFDGELVPKNVKLPNKGKSTKNIQNNISERIKPYISDDSQTLIYMGSKGKVEKLALEIGEFFNINMKDGCLNDFCNYLTTNFDGEYLLIKCLKKGIGFHHRGMPKFVQNWILHLFNKGIIRVLICTATIIEGVNTTAKTVIIGDKLKGKSSLTKFDRKNIYGRSGRFGKYFCGNVIDLYNEDDYKKGTEDIVKSQYSDIKKLNKKNKTLLKYLVDEDHNDLTETYVREEEYELNELVLGLPDVLKQNKFIDENKQIELVNHFTSGNTYEINNKNDYIKIINCVNKYLIVKKKIDDYIAKQSYRYICEGEILFVKNFIRFYKNRGCNFQKIMNNLFDLIYNDFNYHIPKYLSCFQNIYNLVARQKGFKEIQLDYYIKKLEFGYSESHEILLKNRGVPENTINKIKQNFKGISTYKEMEKKLNELLLFDEIDGIHDFEIEYLKHYLGIKE